MHLLSDILLDNPDLILVKITQVNSDQASCCEKYGKSVSSSLWDTLDGQGIL